MKRRVTGWALLTAAWLLTAPRPAAAQGATPAGFESTPRVAARLWVDGRSAAGQLVGRTERQVLFQPEAGSAATAVAVEGIQRAVFDLEFRRSQVNEAAAHRDWRTAAARLSGAVRLALPYLDLPGNNGAPLAVEAAGYLMQAAGKAAREGAAAEETTPLYQAAHDILTAAGQAAWFEEAAAARIRAVQCLERMGRHETAAGLLAGIDEPGGGEPGAGLYWLLRAEMAWREGDHAAALDAAARSVAYADRSIETFPAALLLSARAYGAIGEWARARDVYYEVARLFPRTEFEEQARAGLVDIRDNRRAAGERGSAVNAFFGVQEDVDALVEDYLGSGPPPAADEPAETDEREEDADLPWS